MGNSRQGQWLYCRRLIRKAVVILGSPGTLTQSEMLRLIAMATLVHQRDALPGELGNLLHGQTDFPQHDLGALA